MARLDVKVTKNAAKITAATGLVAALLGATAKESRDAIGNMMTSSEVTKAEQLSTKCVQSKFSDCQKGWW
jgi:redox-regulated HSP33 family molecular chaperone